MFHGPRLSRQLIGLALLSIAPMVRGATPIQELANRVLHQRAASFVFETIPSKSQDVFEIEARGDKIVVRGNTPAVQASGLMEYLKEYCHCDVSWTGRQLSLPKNLPKPDHTLRRVSPFRHRYYLNFCTFNYTMSFWDWPRWERELDWMALNGVNQCLAAQIGQEAVWQRVMKRLGESDSEVAQYLPGPAFGAWWMMGNLQGWGGPDPQWWIDRQAKLQKKILTRMRELGIEPVLSAFYGNVPSSLKGHYSDSKFVSTGKWVGFDRPDMIVPIRSPFWQGRRHLL
jgi:alpha-N-acetylglucosaminidase